MTVNNHRNEVEFKLAGETYEVRPTFDLLARIETAGGRGAIETLQRLSERKLTLVETAQLVAVALATVPRGPKVKEVQEAVFLEGYFSFYEPLAALLASVIPPEEVAGDDAAPGKRKAG
jgi:hypothetical protein